MIPQHAITAWRKIANWVSPDQVEHDLVLSRAICELYANPIISEKLVFRGGTALQLGGWSDYDTVLRYAHLSSDHLQKAASRVSGMFSSPLVGS